MNLKRDLSNGSVQTRRRRTRTAKVWTALSCPCPTGQRTEFLQKSGQNPDIGQNRDKQNPDRQTSDRKSGKNPDSRQKPDGIFRKILTKTRHEQDTDSAVRRRLVQTITKKGKVEKINLGLVQTLFNL